MKYLIFCLLVLAFCLSSFKSLNNDKGPKPKKVYKDTIYLWKTKTKPVVTTSPKKPAVAEEDRAISITSEITKFKVKKSAQKLYVYFGDTVKVFKISLGANPIGHKQKQGDNKTPEGTYTITYKNPNSRGFRSLKLSYPNDNDRKNAKKLGVSPGGDICIHGLWYDTQDPKNHWKDNWTQGCIAVNNQQIEEIFQHTKVNTEITILP